MSELTGERYPITLVLKVVDMSSNGWYGRPRHKDNPQKRGRKPAVGDEELLGKIRETIESVPFCGEGYKKVCHRLNKAGIKVGKSRVQRLMRENDLMSPYRHQQARKKKSEHKGTIITDAPNVMWATDGSSGLRTRDGAGSFQCLTTSTTKSSLSAWRKSETGSPQWSQSGLR